MKIIGDFVAATLYQLIKKKRKLKKKTGSSAQVLRRRCRDAQQKWYERADSTTALGVTVHLGNDDGSNVHSILEALGLR
jgi:phosphate/sulfate permease